MRRPPLGAGDPLMALHPEHDLLQAYLNGELDAVGQPLLESRLLHEPALADALLILCREDATMREWSESTSASELTPTEHTIPSRRSMARLSMPLRFAAIAVVAA